jgi:hypothetical protein
MASVARPAGAALDCFQSIPLPHRPASASRRLVQRFHQAASSARLANLSLVSLSFLQHSSFFSDQQIDHSLSSKAIRHTIFHSASDFVSSCRRDGVSSQCGRTLSSLFRFPFARFHSTHRPAAGDCDAPTGGLPPPGAFAADAASFATERPRYTEPQLPIPLVADRVALPEVAANVSLLSVLPPAARRLYSQPAALLRPRPGPEPGADTATGPPGADQARHFCSRIEYVRLIRRLVDKNMVAFTDRPRAVNGLFGVDKDGSQIRLIIDARPANMLFVDPPTIHLPTPAHLAALQSPCAAPASDGPIYVAKVDLSNFYHQLRLPTEWAPYFCLPPLRPSELGMTDDCRPLIYPMCLTLPMGFSHAVALAQLVHEHVLYSCGALAKSDNVLSLRSPLLDRCLHLLYIDDNVLMDPDLHRIQQVYARVLAAYHRVGLLLNERKLAPPTSAPTEVLGILFDGTRRVLSIAPRRMVELLATTEAVLRGGLCSGQLLSQLVGAWTWALLLRRPALSVLHYVYRFMHVADRRTFRLWPSVARELYALCGLVPFLRVTLQAATAPLLLATDACMSGGALVTTPLTPEQSRILWPVTLGRPAECVPTSAQQQNGLSSATAARQAPSLAQPALSGPARVTRILRPGSFRVLPRPSAWTTVLATPWKHAEHINALELRAVLLAARWLASQAKYGSSRALLLIDSAVAFFSLRKGRSSSPGLMFPLRKIAAVCLAANITLLPVWVPSERNPADRPSRRYEPPAAAAHPWSRAIAAAQPQ